MRAPRRDVPRTASAGRRSSRGPARAPPCARASPSGDPTNGLRSYPKDTLTSPLDERTRELRGRARRRHADGAARRRRHRETTDDRSGDGFAGVFADAAAGQGVLVLLLLVAFGWGALHALSPGHGKAMVAAYLIGTRGTARHAVGLGAIVTFTHTIGVFALGLVTLLLSQYILPEDLYPWLNLVVRAAGRDGRARRAALARARGARRQAPRARSRITTTITTTPRTATATATARTTTTSRPRHLAGAGRDGRGRRA